jgi:DNA polymerase (family 10)
MNNKLIINELRSLISLMELHDEPENKVKIYHSAVFVAEKNIDIPLYNKSEQELISMGFSKTAAAKIADYALTGILQEKINYLSITPTGLLDVLQIKGLGAKKVRLLWKELGIDNIDLLWLACKTGKVASVKGFGEKTQQQIIEKITFIRDSFGKLHLNVATDTANHLKSLLQNYFEVVEITGEVRRCMEVVSVISFLVQTDNFQQGRDYINALSELTYQETISNPFVWRGKYLPSATKVEIRMVNSDSFFGELLVHSSSEKHLQTILNNGHTLLNVARLKGYDSEAAIYEAVGMQYVAPEMREGNDEIALAQAGTLPLLVEMSDLKGVLHNHSTYSDGKHSIEEMALYCKELGYQYLGITDHSVTAYYANGLSIENIRQQHQEIDRLNLQLAPFKIFKGIESDILLDGSLDYPDEILASFDFIVASVHSPLEMDEAKATERLLRAIANPYTTILGHPTGRLLLKRAGYPINHQKVIDACATHGVVIEINANPWRLDLDWRWVRYALGKGVKISINPDAHEKDGYADMLYGLKVGRKAGLTKNMTFNALTVSEIGSYFTERKENTKKNHTL